ncbi:hypothetical protein GCM10018790_23990 [Kitasatospora xanthocidica]|nr:hypothetical protein GCM10018790_23990 [Kitasatospora xanthocidica]
MASAVWSPVMRMLSSFAWTAWCGVGPTRPYRVRERGWVSGRAAAPRPDPVGMPGSLI